MRRPAGLALVAVVVAAALVGLPASRRRLLLLFRPTTAARAGGPTAGHALAAEPPPPIPADRPASFTPVTFARLGRATYDPPRSVIPDDVRALEGTWVEVVGYMVPLISPEDLSRFVLITQANVECFFCNPVTMPKTVEVRTYEGVPVEWDEEPVRVRGMFFAGDSPGEVAIYRIRALSVDPVDEAVR